MKIKFVLGALLFIATANAADMCVSNDAVMVVLDPQIAGTTSSYDTTSGTWSVQFSYGVVSGIVGCDGVRRSVGAVATGALAITNGHCYCKMLRPVESMWVSSGSSSVYSSLDACHNACSNVCASTIKSTLNMRQGLFGNIVQ